MNNMQLYVPGNAPTGSLLELYNGYIYHSDNPRKPSVSTHYFDVMTSIATWRHVTYNDVTSLSRDVSDVMSRLSRYVTYSDVTSRCSVFTSRLCISSRDNTLLTFIVALHHIHVTSIVTSFFIVYLTFEFCEFLCGYTFVHNIPIILTMYRLHDIRCIIVYRI